ncbi:hypothetical protein QMZ65_03255 [Pantoea sp. EABMAA-21]|uniref:hypothetical protein n=1 Tax=Pantoea sp. EABMAA-21 TaxID=3043302 RepID=UPI0024B5DCDE|nr:hypothetical protein [Pantoea sp. EABMAA-21]MDI9276223.1 hypothetical protein [Pantoea sp. EABMAA-21]
MERCKQCHKWYGKPKEVKVGDDVAFTFEKVSGKRRQICGRVGKLFLIKDDGFSVIYRGTVHHADEVASPDEPSPLTLAFCGVCECEGRSADSAKGGSDD